VLAVLLAAVLAVLVAVLPVLVLVALLAGLLGEPLVVVVLLASFGVGGFIQTLPPCSLNEHRRPSQLLSIELVQMSAMIFI
jgi:hypothetical protein